MNEEKITFEEAMNTLDEVLKALNAGDIPLEEAVNQYGLGMKMAQICQEKLSAVEGELVRLSDAGEVPFRIDEEVAR